MIGAVTILANAAGELMGYGGISTPDPIDFAYGLAGGYIYYKATKPTFIPEEEVDEIAKFNTDEVKVHLDEKDRFIVEKYSAYKEKITNLKLSLKKKTPSTKTMQHDKQKRTKPLPNKRYTPPKQRPKRI